MCSNTESHHERCMARYPDACLCGCDDSFRFGPRFMTKERWIVRLEHHLENLRDEATAIEEHLAGIRKAK